MDAASAAVPVQLQQRVRPGLDKTQIAIGKGIGQAVPAKQRVAEKRVEVDAIACVKGRTDGEVGDMDEAAGRPGDAGGCKGQLVCAAA